MKVCKTYNTYANMMSDTNPGDAAIISETGARFVRKDGVWVFDFGEMFDNADIFNVVLDDTAKVTGLCNLAGGLGLEILSYRRLHDTNDAAGAIIQVAPIGNDVHNAQGRYVSLYNSSKVAIAALSADKQAQGLYGVPTGGTAGFILCTADLVKMIDTVVNRGSGNLILYYVDVAHASTPTSGTQYINLSYDTLAGYGTLYWKLDTGTTVAAASNVYFTTDKLVTVGLGTYANEEETFFDVYLSDKSTIVISASDFNTNTYYFDDGTVVTSVGQLVATPFRDVYDNDSQTGTPVIQAEDILSGLFKKEGTSFVKVQPFMVPEKFDQNLFNGEIYIHPGTGNYSGTANRFYTYGSIVGTDVAFVTKTSSGETTLEKVIIKLSKAVTDDSTSYSPKPGSIGNPMLAVVRSDNRYSVSTVSGEYNSAVGFNSGAGGNQNTVFGDFSEAKGLSNVISGDMSFAQGAFNTVVASKSNAYGHNNIVAGTQNITVGNGNITQGYYGVTIGDGNQTVGISDIAVGSRNAVYTQTGGAVVVGDQNIAYEKAKDSIVLGKELSVEAEGATVVGQKGVVSRFNGSFPGEDYDTLTTISVNSVNSWKSLGYDEVWTSNKDGLFFGAGLKANNITTSIFPIAFTKYRVRPNIATYFSLGTTASARASKDPYLYEPFMQWSLIGVLSVNFTDPQPDATDATKFTFSQRNGGRVKSFDPGVEYNSTAATAVELNFDKATRWKIKGSGLSALTPVNFVDGAEAYVILYAGSNVSWTPFTSNSSTIEGANEFDSLVWSGGSVIDPSSYSQGFAMLKLHIVDNVCVVEIIVNTLSA